MFRRIVSLSFALLVAICLSGCNVAEIGLNSNTLAQAKAGNPKAQFEIGSAYLVGDGVRKDSSRAALWFEKAAQQNHTYAQMYLSSMYEDGDGVPRDLSKAAYWDKRAAEAGERDAQQRLAQRYYNGDGVAKDNTVAAEWFRKAAAQGQEGAKEMLREMTAKGPIAPDKTTQSKVAGFTANDSQSK